MAIGKKLILVLGAAGAGLYFANENGMLDNMFPEDPYDDIEDSGDEEDPYNDEVDLNINNPLALMAISMATRAGLKGAAKAVKKVVAPKTIKPPAVPSAPKAAGVKPATPSVTKAADIADAAPKKVVNPADAAPSKASGPKPATAATNAAAAKPPPAPPAGPAAKSAAKAGKAGSMMSKLKGTPADLIVMVIAQILAAVLDLDPDSFKDCETGEFDMGKLPDWAQAMIGAIPFLGDLFDLIGNKLCLKAGCPKDAPDESAGLCYKACDPGFKSDGAIMCYKQYPEFEGNGMLHTITSITKKILMDTGKIPERCNDDEDKSGALCYEKVEGYTNVAGTVWQNCPAGHTDTGVRCEKLHTLPAGTLPRLTDCPGGWTNDGLTCREPITMSSCPGGWVDDGLLCRNPIRCDPIGCHSAHDCFIHGRCGCWGGGCHGGEVEKKNLYGGRIEGRTLKGPDGDEDRIDGLDYKKCPDGMSHQPGMPYLCSASFTKQSRVLAPRPLKCNRTRKEGVAAGQVEWDEETNISGLCYGKIPPGYSRKTLGLLDQDCPGGSQDFGVGCTRQSYSRGAGVIPLGIRVKERK